MFVCFTFVCVVKKYKTCVLQKFKNEVLLKFANEMQFCQFNACKMGRLYS